VVEQDPAFNSSRERGEGERERERERLEVRVRLEGVRDKRCQLPWTPGQGLGWALMPGTLLCSLIPGYRDASTLTCIQIHLTSSEPEAYLPVILLVLLILQGPLSLPLGGYLLLANPAQCSLHHLIIPLKTGGLSFSLGRPCPLCSAGIKGRGEI
jgi:hypothetical protein